MSFWEKAHWAIAVATVLAGGFYFTSIVRASSELGQVAAPDLRLFMVYVVIQVVLIVVGMIVISIFDRIAEGDGFEQVDERDDVIRVRSQAAASHVTATLIVISLLAFFHHRDGNLLFHSALAGLMVGEIARSVSQILAYRRGV